MIKSLVGKSTNLCTESMQIFRKLNFISKPTKTDFKIQEVLIKKKVKSPLYILGLLYVGQSEIDKIMYNICKN